MDTLIGKHWHHLPEQEVAEIIGTDPDRGLDLFEIRKRLEHFGPNTVTGKKGKGPLLRFLLQFHQPLIYILLVSGVITAVFKAPVDASVIFGVVLLNAAVGFLQELKAVKAIDALAKTMVTHANVIRAGQPKKIPSSELVPGDVVVLQSGDKVPADMRLTAVNNLQTDESALTGESLPVQKKPDLLDPSTDLGSRTNMAYASSLVTYGQAKGIVTATGNRTEVGRISELLQTTAELETPLTRKIAAFSHLLLYWILALTVFTFAAGLFQGHDAVSTFIAAVALAVAAIPEGLPAVVTVTLAIGMNRLAKRGAIIRKLPAVETLGSTTVICSDKTGTLTENQMTVQEIRAGGNLFEVSGAGYSEHGDISLQARKADLNAHKALGECLRAGVVCNDSRLEECDGHWRVHGDPTEGALITAAAKAGILLRDLERDLPRIATIPFESDRQYMAVLSPAAGSPGRVIYIKGAVETVLDKCDTLLESNGASSPLNKKTCLSEAEDMARRGLRVLAFAKKNVPAAQTTLGHDEPLAGFTFVGMQGMIDPPRPEAIRAVAACRTAGITVKMITGDHAVTAAAIAKKIGIGKIEPGRETPRALTGRELARLSDGDLIDAAAETSVFARVTPEQKLRLVEALQARGHVIAMTGDGVNDAPALKRADIGVAMGITGTEVAKEAADMILTDDNFATIEAAVEEGRGVFDNLRKFIIWILPTNLGQGLVILAAIVMNIPLPILPVQILWINMTTAVFLGLTLAFEAKESDIMERPPRNPNLSLVSGSLLWRLFIVGILLLGGAFGLFEYEITRGMSEAYARTVAVGVFIIGQTFYLFNCRSLERSMASVGYFTNRWLIGGIAVMMASHLAFIYLPFMNALFHTAPIDAGSWWRTLAVGLVIYAVVGIEKWLRQRWAKHPVDTIR